MKKLSSWLLVTAVIAGLMWLCAPSVAAADRPDMLQSLISASQAELPSRAAELIKKQPQEANLLAIDLIFYRWVSLQYEQDPGMEHLDRVAAALASASADPPVIWSASVLGSKTWTTRAVPSEDDERIKAIIEARQAVRAAVGFSTTYPSRAMESLSACAATVRRLGLELSEAAITERLAERQLYATRRYRDAEANYERAHPVFSAYGLREKVARIFDDLGHLNSEVGRYPDAHSSYRDSAREWQALGKGEMTGRQYINAGLALAASGKPDSALRTMLGGLEFSRGAARASKSYLPHAQLLVQVASFCSGRGQYSEARELLEEAEKAAKNAGDSLLLTLILREQAAAWSSTGQEPRARACLNDRQSILSRLAQKGEEAARKLQDQSIPTAERLTLASTAETGASASTALNKPQQGVNVLKLVVSVYDSMERPDDEIRSLRNLAAQQDASGDRAAGLESRRQAAEIGMRQGKRSLAVDILRDIEQSALDAKDQSTAIEALTEAVQVIEASEDMLALADALKSRGELFASVGQSDSAIRDLGKSASIYAAELGEPWSASEVLAKLAGVQADAGKVADSIESLSRAIKRIEDWATAEGVDAGAEPSRADTVFSLYLQLVGLEMREGKRKEALNHLRTARQYTWFSRLRSLLTASGEPAADQLLKELDKTAGDVAATTPKQPTGPRKIATGWPAVFSQVPQFSRFARSDRYSGPIGPIDATDIYKNRDKFPKGLAVIEYAVSDTAVYALVASKLAVTCWELPVESGRIDSDVHSLRAALAEMEKKVAAGIPLPSIKKNWTDPSLLPILEPLLELNDLLFEPIRGELSGMTMLAFSLPEDLSGIPFHALPKEKPGVVKFLIQDFAVSYLRPGSLDDFGKYVPGPIAAKKEPVAIFADTSGTLPGATREANLIKAHYPKSQIYSGINATAERFVRTAQSCNIIHIAAHHQPDPNPSKFTLTLSGKPGGTGTVRVSDLMRIKNPNLRLVVLSACETVGTSDAQAAGTQYTADFFSLAGFPAVIGGLWKVSDAASVQLMGAFYRNLALPGSKSEALRRAQVSMVESSDGQFAHPFYWATFALYGDPR